LPSEVITKRKEYIRASEKGKKRKKKQEIRVQGPWETKENRRVKDRFYTPFITGHSQQAIVLSYFFFSFFFFFFTLS
jgi:hypothetical protein